MNYKILIIVFFGFSLIFFGYNEAKAVTTNLMIDMGFGVIGSNFVVFPVSEGNQANTDLNGDADTSDSVLHVYDHGTGMVTNLGIAGFPSVIDGNLVVFTVSEVSQGNTDLNGDLDTSDSVLHVYDHGTGMVTNLGLHGFPSAIDGNLVPFTVSESSQGNTDLNGDADMSDSVLHVYDHGTGMVTNVGLHGFPSAIDGNLVAFTVSESSQGNTDLNGDGDMSDFVVHVYDHSVGLPATNVGLHGFPQLIVGNLLPIQVIESAQGNTDLNGDLDALDGVLHVYDHSVGLPATNLGLAGGAFAIDGNLVSFTVSESSQGNTDLNGDADTTDFGILHVYDHSVGLPATNLGIDAGFTIPQLAGTIVSFSVNEANQANTDLNGDLDALDNVLHVYDHSVGLPATNVGLDTAFSTPQLAGTVVAFSVNEANQGNTDLNGDADTTDFGILHVYDHSVGLPATNVGVDTNFAITPIFGNFVPVLVPEAAQGNNDLNGDLDTSDTVLYVYDHSVGLPATNFGLAGFFQFTNSIFVAISVPEFSQGNMDLNGDLDASDSVLHIISGIPPPDADGDGVPDGNDNCPNNANPFQEDTDGSGIGDACNSATDPDGDEYENSFDNCPNDFNPGQEDEDGDGIGDLCDTYCGKLGNTYAMIIYGTAGNDNIAGTVGDDLIFAKAGNDEVNADAGDDCIFGEDGNDTLRGNDGNDEIHGGNGDDTIRGKDGNDILNGDAGFDNIFGGNGDDTINGGDDGDLIKGQKGADTINGDGGDDIILSHAENDVVNGGAGNDWLWLGPGDDTANGGPGNDVIEGRQGTDTVDCGDGFDAFIDAADSGINCEKDL